MELYYEVSHEIPSYWQRLKLQCSWQNFCCVSLVILLPLLTAVYAIVTLNIGNDQSCIVNLPTFEIKYDLWMKIYAYTNLICTPIIISLLIAMICKMNSSQALNWTTKWLSLICLGFQTAWYVVHCIFFFNRNTENCNRHLPVYSFAICMMFIQPAIISFELMNILHLIQSDFYQLEHRQHSNEHGLDHQYVNAIV
jgi:hypothetical protein